ncbi:MAG: DUF2333 family protein [Candidatus Paceibacterota bacterium]|nr:DUF2333 family protein [Candidatus Paceibacterota bacterium]
MTEKTAPQTGSLAAKKGHMSRTIHFLYGATFHLLWRMIKWPWKQISPFWHWWHNGAADWKYRYLLAGIPAVIILIALVLGPLWSTYPAVWVGTYAYNYTSVIYPKEIPNVMPIESSQQLAEYNENQGTALADTMISITSEMIVNWQDNDLPWASSKTGIFGVDNPRNFQIGQLQMVRFVLQEMRDNFTKNGKNDAFNPFIERAYNKFAWDSDSWAFPRTEGVYKDGLNAIKAFRFSLEKGKAHIYPTTYNSGELLKTMAAVLANSARRLESVEKTRIPLLSTHEDSSGKSARQDNAPENISWNEMDNAYYHGQGSLYTAVQVLKALRVDARKAVASKSANELFARVIQRIETNTAYLKDPILVVNETTFSPSNCSPLALALQSASKDMENLAMQLNH